MAPRACGRFEAEKPMLCAARPTTPQPLVYIFEGLVGENNHRYPMSLASLECQVSELVNSNTCPRPTTDAFADAFWAVNHVKVC